MIELVQEYLYHLCLQHYYTYINFIAIFGINKSSPEHSFGPYYYFTNYENSLKYAIWSKGKEEIHSNNKSIIINDYGLHKKGGIIRSAIFTDNTLYYINKNDNNINYTNTEWINKYDSIFISYTNPHDPLNNTQKNSNKYILKNFNQQYTLSYHYVNTDIYINNSKMTVKNFNIE